jgi:hypothetical protein
VTCCTTRSRTGSSVDNTFHHLLSVWETQTGHPSMACDSVFMWQASHFDYQDERSKLGRSG